MHIIQTKFSGSFRKAKCFNLSVLLLALLTAVTFAAPEDSYRLTPVDQVEMTIFRHPKMNIKQRLDGQGNISLPLLGSTHLGGLTLTEAENKIAKAYQTERYLRNPSLTLSITDYSPKSITVMGEVENPGEVKLPAEANNLAISKAIAMAGGFTNTAKQNDVKVIRMSEEGNRITYNIDVSESHEEGDDQNQAKSQLEPGDTVIVKRRFF